LQVDAHNFKINFRIPNFITTFVLTNKGNMKASKRKIVNHLKAGKPWMYKNHPCSEPNTIHFVSEVPWENGEISYTINTKILHTSGNVLINPFDIAPITFKPTGHMEVFLNIGDINARVTLNFDKIILLDNKYKPLQ